MHDHEEPKGSPSPRTRSWKQPNRGELSYAEKHPADPLGSEEARLMSHRGGVADHRNQHY